MRNDPNLEINNSDLYDNDSHSITNETIIRRGSAKQQAKVKRNIGQLTRFTRSNTQYGKYTIIEDH